MPESETPSSLPPSPRGKRSRAHSSMGTRMSAWLRHWARDTFSRDQMVSSLKSLAWVAPLTLLIWVYAEREQIYYQKDQTIPITVKSDDPKLVVTVEQDEQNIIGEISGPHAAVDRVIEQLNLIPSSKQGVVIAIPASYPTGPNSIPTSWISDADIFKKAGVTVGKTSPINLHVMIDRMEDHDVEVKAPSAAEIPNLVNTPAFEPRTVRITCPHNFWEAADGKLTVTADLKDFQELRNPGKHELTNVPLKLSMNDKNVTVSPAVIKAAIEVRTLDATFPLPSLPIWVTYPPNFDDLRVVFEGSNTVINVTLAGPSDHIDAIKRKDTSIPQPKVRLEVNPNDKNAPGTTKTGKLIFDLPFPDVHVSEKDMDRAVEYHLTSPNAANP